MTEIHIDTQGMDSHEKTVALVTAIFDNITLKPKKRKAKEIREANRKTDRDRKKREKFNH